MNTQNKILLGVSLFAMTFSFGTTAQTCKPVPSCESLGYTETSCSGDSLKCPFDTSKMYCIEKCPLICKVGDIYYSDDTCSSEVISGKTPIGVVYDLNRKLVVSLERVTKYWNDGSSDWKDISALTNYTSTSTAQQDFNGKSNTDAIVAFAASSGQAHEAAQYCHDKTTGGKTWYLPALGEMMPLATNYSTVNASLSKVGTALISTWHWSSTETNYNIAYILTPSLSNFNRADKSDYNNVRCIFAYE